MRKIDDEAFETTERVDESADEIFDEAFDEASTSADADACADAVRFKSLNVTMKRSFISNSETSHALDFEIESSVRFIAAVTRH